MLPKISRLIGLKKIKKAHNKKKTRKKIEQRKSPDFGQQQRLITWVGWLSADTSLSCVDTSDAAADVRAKLLNQVLSLWDTDWCRATRPTTFLFPVQWPSHFAPRSRRRLFMYVVDKWCIKVTANQISSIIGSHCQPQCLFIHHPRRQTSNFPSHRASVDKHGESQRPVCVCACIGGLRSYVADINAWCHHCRRSLVCTADDLDGRATGRRLDGAACP